MTAPIFMLLRSLGSSLIIFSSFLFFRSLVKNDSLGNFDAIYDVSYSN